MILGRIEMVIEGIMIGTGAEVGISRVRAKEETNLEVVEVSEEEEDISVEEISIKIKIIGEVVKDVEEAGALEREEEVMDMVEADSKMTEKKRRSLKENIAAYI